MPRYMLKSVNTLMQKANNIACLVIQMMMMDILRCKRRHEHLYRKKAFLAFCRELQKK